MANHKSAKKRIRQNEKRRERNRNTKSACRTAIKATKSAVEAGDLEKAEIEFKKAEKRVASAAAKGIYHWKNASRKISRIPKMLSAAKKK